MQEYNVDIKLARADLATAAVRGYCAPAFRPLLDAFVENFEQDVEQGASLAVEQDGETVIDVWGGFADAASRRAWERDTIGIVFSNTKAATALCAHLLVDAGLLKTLNLF